MAMMGSGCVWLVLVAITTGWAMLAEFEYAGATRGAEQVTRGTIAFATVGRAHFAFDLFGVSVPGSWFGSSGVLHDEDLNEVKLTDGVSINYNGQFVEGAARSAVLERLRKEGVNADEFGLLIFVSERDGSTRVYIKTFFNETETTGEQRRREMGETEFSKTGRVVVDAWLPSNGPVLFDRPSVTGNSIVFVSTIEADESPRQSWAAVYSTSLETQTTMKLTPKGLADFSPSVSPSGEWVAVASENTFEGEEAELLTDLYVYKVKDGSNRLLLMKHGGWPTWADERTIFFHRKVDDGWWSVFRIWLPENFLSAGEGEVQEERITPPGVHAFTPAASPTGKWIAVATRRPGSQFRHVEIFDLTSLSFIKLTERISPTENHYNPFVSMESGFVGYHRCRGNSGGTLVVPVLQPVRSPLPDLSLVRVDGTFPTISPDGSLLAFIRNFEDSALEISDDDSGIFVISVHGTGERKVLPGLAFSPAWDRKRKGVLFASYGPEFRSKASVQIISVHNVDRGELSWKQLTKAGNNAFPSPSPDGKYVVFRSSRSGHKNLYIMDALEGEEKEIRRLTEGPWTDQHPNWSPSGEWIAFTSNRENPSAESYSIYLVHPDGTGLKKLLQSGQEGLAVHPHFSPDGRKLVFVSDLAGGSGEPVSEPYQFLPYGEVFIADVDGSNIHRLTHNVLEDGTPSWSPSFLSSSNLTAEGKILQCNFEDIRWLNSEAQSDRLLPAIQCPFSRAKAIAVEAN